MMILTILIFYGRLFPKSEGWYMPQKPRIPNLFIKISDNPDSCNPDYDAYMLYKRLGNAAEVARHVNTKLKEKGYTDTVTPSGMWRHIERITKDLIINGFGLNGSL